MGVFLRLAKRLLQRALAPRGYELRQISEGQGRGFEAMLRHAKMQGLNPDVVYDVGAGVGTPWLYEAFPKARHILIEPLPSHLMALRPLVDRLGAQLHGVALSRTAGTQRLRVPARTTGSSLMEPSGKWFALGLNKLRGLSEDVDYVDVPVTTLDSIHQGGRGVLKIDVEGAEMDVLAGGRKTLTDIDLLIMEMSVFPRLIQEPDFAQKIKDINEMGFEVFDIPALSYPIPGSSLGFIDIAFTPKCRPLW
jgi:FkbM family methyltransferase